MALIKCPDCKKKISDSVEACPKCGCKITEEKIKEAENKRRKNKKKKIIFFVVCMVIFAGIGFCLIYVRRMEINKQKEYQRIEQEKKDKDNELKEKNKKDFIDCIKNTKESTDEFYLYLSEKSTIIVCTWYNCIYEEKDKDTDKYTLKKNGKFKDFSDAVNDCINDIFSSKKFTSLYDEYSKNKKEYESFKINFDFDEEFAEQKEKNDKYIENIQKYYDTLSYAYGTYNEFYDKVCEIEYENIEMKRKATTALEKMQND